MGIEKAPLYRKNIDQSLQTVINNNAAIESAVTSGVRLRGLPGMTESEVLAIVAPRMKAIEGEEAIFPRTKVLSTKDKLFTKVTQASSECNKKVTLEYFKKAIPLREKGATRIVGQVSILAEVLRGAAKQFKEILDPIKDCLKTSATKSATTNLKLLEQTQQRIEWSATNAIDTARLAVDQLLTKNRWFDIEMYFAAAGQPGTLDEKDSMSKKKESWISEDTMQAHNGNIADLVKKKEDENKASKLLRQAKSSLSSNMKDGNFKRKFGRFGSRNFDKTIRKQNTRSRFSSRSSSYSPSSSFSSFHNYSFQARGCGSNAGFRGRGTRDGFRARGNFSYRARDSSSYRGRGGARRGGSSSRGKQDA